MVYDDILYMILRSLSEANKQCQVKGATLLKFYLESRNLGRYMRVSEDFDVGVAGGKRDRVIPLLNNSFKKLNYPLVAKSDNSGRHQSRIILIDSSGAEVATVDVQKREIEDGEAYKFRGLMVMGTSIYALITDKMEAISRYRIFGRSKDLYDLYVVLGSLTLTVSEVYRQMAMKTEAKNRLFSACEELYSAECEQDIKQAYEELKGITEKIPFDAVITYARNLMQPFRHNPVAVTGMQDMVWDHKAQKWKTAGVELKAGSGTKYGVIQAVETLVDSSDKIVGLSLHDGTQEKYVPLKQCLTLAKKNGIANVVYVHKRGKKPYLRGLNGSLRDLPSREINDVRFI